MIPDNPGLRRQRAINSLKPGLGNIEARYRRQIDVAERAGFMRQYCEQLRAQARRED